MPERSYHPSLVHVCRGNYGDAYIQPLLNCGHLGQPLIQADFDQWDPADPFFCTRCKQDRQMSIDLQIAVYAFMDRENHPSGQEQDPPAPS